MSNYTTKAGLENAAGVDTSNFTKKTDLAHLKSDVDKLDIDKLKNVPSGLISLQIKVDKLDIGILQTTPIELSKLSYIVNNEVTKMTEYNELVKKVNNINTTDTMDLVKKTGYNTKSNEIEKTITDHDHDKFAQANVPSKNDIVNFIKKTDFYDKLKKEMDKLLQIKQDI